LNKAEFRYYYKTLSHFFDSVLLHKSFNGAILIAKKGAIIYEKYSGLVDLRKRDSITATTALHIASTSKTFTAMAILRMVDEKKLALNDSLSKFFPGLPYPGITVKMLLDHRSGLPNYIYFIPDSKWDSLPACKAGKKYVTNNDVLNLLYTIKPKRSFAPGTRFSYSNTNFVLLALIIEKISGENFPEFMKRTIFTPLQMRDTYIFTLADSVRSTQSFNWNASFWAYDYLEATYGDKNVYTTPRDLLKWDQALYTNQVVSKTLLDSAFMPYSLEKRSIHNYGLGWRMLLMPNGKKVIYHFGRWHGFNAAFARLMDEQVTIIILGNRFDRNIYNTAHQAYDLFGDYQQHHATEEEEPENTPSNKKTPSVKAKKKKFTSKKH
jgi:CubicO group peptidase (beta-lactamase class C family)